MEPIDKKIFVIGTGRCGTNWVGIWLRQHPKIFGGTETHIFSLISNILNPEWEQGLSNWVSKDEIIAQLRVFIENSLGRYKFRKSSENHLVEYSSIHFDHRDFILNMYPDAYFIHIYRDGRNVVESKSHLNISCDEAIDNWIRTISESRLETYPKFLNVRYEDLVAAPDKSQSITKFLGIDHHKNIDSWEFPVNTTHFSYDPNRWKTLPDDILAKFQEGEMAELLLELGYTHE